MSEPVDTHKSCPSCGHSGCLTIFEDGGWFCHSCGSTPKKNKSTPKVEEESIDLEIKEYRSIDKDVVEFYGILTGVVGGKDFNRVYPYPHMPKTRVLPKDFTQNKGFKNNMLFGMDKFNAGSSKVLTIVEGEDDVPSAYQMLGKRYPVVGMAGGSAKQVLKNPMCREYIDAFETIVLATDSDDAGNAAAEVFSRTFPNKCYRVNMTKHKDPNDYLTNGDGSDFLYAWINRKKYVPENIFNTPEQFEKILKDDKGSMYLPTGIKDFDEKALGLFQGYWTLFQAPEGIGKTEFMRKLEYTILSEHPTVPIAVMHLEETKKRSLLGLASYVLKKDVTLQDTKVEINDEGEEEIVYLPSYKGVPEDEVMGAIHSFTERENFYQFTLGVDDDPESILDQIRYFSEVCGVKYVFFEPIQDLGYSRQDDSSLESWLSQLSTKMARLCSELGVGVISIAHENDDGQIRDCRMIGKRAGVVVKLERDKQAMDDEMRNTTALTILKNRPVGNTGFAGELMFDPSTFTLEEKSYD